jgi:hypothetical protein
MQLLYTTHNSILHLHGLTPVLSWMIVIGGVYGVFRLIYDAILLTRFARRPGLLGIDADRSPQ